MLFEKIKKDKIEAFKNKENSKKDLLRVLEAEASKESKQPDYAKVIATIRKFISNAEEVIARLSPVATGDPALNILAQAENEIEILKAYLPKQLSENGLRTAVTQAINLGNDNIGSVMKYLKENFEGRYDGKLASQIIKESLA